MLKMNRTGTDESYTFVKTINERTGESMRKSINENDNNVEFDNLDAKEIENPVITMEDEIKVTNEIFKPDQNFSSNPINNLYERMIRDLRSEIRFLRSQFESRESHFLDEITFLREQLDFSHRSVKRDERIFSLQAEISNLQQNCSPRNFENQSTNDPNNGLSGMEKHLN